VIVHADTRAADPFPATDLDPTGALPNTATVTAPGTNCPDPQAGCDATITRPLQPQLTVTKTTTANRIPPGAVVPYTITVTNSTPVTAVAVEVTDTLPTALTFVSSDNPACTSEDGKLVSCQLGDLAPGAVVTIGIVVEATGPFLPGEIEDGQIHNTAAVLSPSSNCPRTGTVADECRSTVDTPIGPTLAIAKSTTLDRIVPGQPVPYTLTVTNTGVVPVAAVVVTDPLPAGLTFTSSDDPACTSADGVTVTCALGTLPVDGVRVLGIVAQAADPFPAAGVGAGGNVVNRATVASPGTNCPNGDPDGPECIGTAATPLQSRLTIAKTSPATRIVPGQDVPWSITVTNTGTVPATGVRVTDPLPAGLTFVSSPDGCTSATGTTVTCDLGDLAAGAAVTVNLVTRAADPFPGAAVTAAGEVANTASVTAPGSNCLAPAAVRPAALFARAVIRPEAAADDVCDATAALPVQPQVTIVKTADTAQVVPGAQVAWRITVTNTTPVTAPGVVVTDPLAAGLTFVSSDRGCTAAGGTVTCRLGDMAAGSSVTVRLVTRAADPLPAAAVDSTGAVPNTATVTVAGSNCGPAAVGGQAAVVPAAGEVCSATARVPVQPTLSLVKTSTASGVAAGATIPYRLTATNLGMVTAPDVTIVDRLPAGLTFVSSDGNCTAGDGGRTVTCPVGDLAPGASATVQVLTRAADPFPSDGVANGMVTNQATITGSASNCVGGTTDDRCIASAALPATPDVTPAPAPGGGGPGHGVFGLLPRTGAELGALVLAGLAALAAGLVLRTGARRRRAASTTAHSP